MSFLRKFSAAFGLANDLKDLQHLRDLKDKLGDAAQGKFSLRTLQELQKLRERLAYHQSQLPENKPKPGSSG